MGFCYFEICKPNKWKRSQKLLEGTVDEGKDWFFVLHCLTQFFMVFSYTISLNEFSTLT